MTEWHRIVDETNAVIGYVAEVRPGDWHAETKHHGEVSGCHPTATAAAQALRDAAPCRTCRGARWVDDEGWQPDYPEQRRTDLRRGDYVGLLPCPECNADGQHCTIEEARP